MQHLDVLNGTSVIKSVFHIESKSVDVDRQLCSPALSFVMAIIPAERDLNIESEPHSLKLSERKRISSIISIQTVKLMEIHFTQTDAL